VYPYLSADLPGIGGSIKDDPEDFIVEEIPAYQPCGRGEHLYVQVEKRGLGTLAMIQQLARASGIRERNFGYAGLKDARAVCRQTISIHTADDSCLAALNNVDGVTVLGSARHGNKLRLGHLRGNRFIIRLRNVDANAVARLKALAQLLQSRGVPNYFGSQRYGIMGNNHLIGAAMLQRDFTRAIALFMGDARLINNERWRLAVNAFRDGDLNGALAAFPGRFRDERRVIHLLLAGKSAEQAFTALPRKLLKLYLSAWQSWLFDRQVAARIATLDTLLKGDIAMIHASGACFRVEDPAAEQPRADQLEISPTGLMAGRKAMYADTAVERELIAAEHIDDAAFNSFSAIKLQASRRPLRVAVTQLDWRVDGANAILSFTLPAGSYATSVLREITKNGASPETEKK